MSDTNTSNYANLKILETVYYRNQILALNYSFCLENGVMMTPNPWNVCFSVILFFSSALAGLALTYALQTLDVIQYGVRSASEVENFMTSVERVMTYSKINSEPGYSTEDRAPPSWPSKGSLDLKDLSLTYFKGGPRVLSEISVPVSSKEKVGVVGRTGAGKSSLVSALFRMPDPLGKVR